MKIKVKDLKRLIRENYAREIPQHAIDEMCEMAFSDPKNAVKHCKEKMQHHLTKHIYSTSVSRADMVQKINKMNLILRNLESEISELESLKDELREVIEQNIRRFLFI